MVTQKDDSNQEMEKEGPDRQGQECKLTGFAKGRYRSGWEAGKV